MLAPLGVSAPLSRHAHAVCDIHCPSNGQGAAQDMSQFHGVIDECIPNVQCSAR